MQGHDDLAGVGERVSTRFKPDRAVIIVSRNALEHPSGEIGDDVIAGVDVDGVVRAGDDALVGDEVSTIGNVDGFVHGAGNGAGVVDVIVAVIVQVHAVIVPALKT